MVKFRRRRINVNIGYVRRVGDHEVESFSRERFEQVTSMQKDALLKVVTLDVRACKFKRIRANVDRMNLGAWKSQSCSHRYRPAPGAQFNNSTD